MVSREELDDDFCRRSIKKPNKYAGSGMAVWKVEDVEKKDKERRSNRERNARHEKRIECFIDREEEGEVRNERKLLTGSSATTSKFSSKFRIDTTAITRSSRFSYWLSWTRTRLLLLG